MNVIPLLVVCSLFLALCGVALFVWSARRGDHEYVDRLSLLPLEEDSNVIPNDEDPIDGSHPTEKGVNHVN